jgi:hypothetical protein
MPATSVAQQRLMGMAYALKKGELDPSDASQEVKDLADSMTLKQLKDYASTKHEGLPKKKVMEYYYWWDTQAMQMTAAAMSMKSDQTDPLVQSFMDFIDGKKKKASSKELEEDLATVVNTPGMGNAVPATATTVGSGDTFSAKSRKKKVKPYQEWDKMRD